MKKQTLTEENAFSEELIPAFLSPDHILERDAANDQPLELLNPIIPEDLPPNDFMIREGVHRAIEYNKLDVFMQPIVTLPQRRTLFYELYGRLRVESGIYANARDYLNVTTEEHIVSNLDTLLLSGALQILKTQQRRSNEEISFFLNIRPFTLRSPIFMEHLLPLLSKHHHVARAMIFEMRFSDFLMLSPAEKKILSGLHQIGCRFSVDHIHHMPEDIKYLNRRGVSFVKLNAQMILQEGRGEEGFSSLLSHKHNLEVNGIDMIVEKVESEDAVLEILDYDIKYAQGFLFGKPDFQGVYL